MGRAFLEVSHEVFARLFSLPPGWKVVGTWPSNHPGSTSNLVLESDELIDPPEDMKLPTIELHITVDHHPDHPDFKRITTIPRIQKASGKEP